MLDILLVKSAMVKDKSPNTDIFEKDNDTTYLSLIHDANQILNTLSQVWKY
jgi:hypothetical protein